MSALVAVLALGCSGERAPGTPPPAGNASAYGTHQDGIRFSATADSPSMVVALTHDADLDVLATNPEAWQPALDAAFAGPEPIARFVEVFEGGDLYFVKGELPHEWGRPRELSCSHLPFAVLDHGGSVVVSIPAGLCGMSNSLVAVEYGPDGLEIADERFIDDPQPAAEPGTVAIDHPASRGFAPGESVAVVLTPVPEEDINPRYDDREWHPLQPFVCFDVTIHAGAAGDDGQVVPDVVVSQAGVPVRIPEPSGADEAPARVVTQDAGGVVLWSFGPIALGDYQPDTITVSASEGDITSWDVSARHC